MKRKRGEQPAAVTGEAALSTEDEPQPQKRKRRRSDGWDWSGFGLDDAECLVGCLTLPLRLGFWVIKAVFEAVTD